MRLLAASAVVLVTLALAPSGRAQDAATVDAPVAEHNAVVEFPGLEAARAAMIDEEIEPYISMLQTSEMSAKTGSPITGVDHEHDTLAKQRTECRKRYAAGTLQFSAEEQAGLTWLANAVTTRFFGEYPYLAEVPWSFIKVKPTIEGGLPHTRGAHIVLTAGVAGRISAMRERDEILPVQRMGRLLIHEQLHVAERRHPHVFEKLYTEEWGFERVPELPTCAWLERNQVVNPDGIDIRWVRPFRRGDETVYVHPRVIFADGDHEKQMPRDFRLIGIFLTKTKSGFALQLDDAGVPKHASLGEIAEYRALFPGLSNIYHPNEALASLFPRMVFADASGAPNARDEALRTWCRAHFSKSE